MHSLPLFFIAVALTGAAQGIALLGGLAVINAIAPPDQRGGVLGAFFFCGCLAVTISAPLLDRIADARGLNVAVGAFAIVMAARGVRVRRSYALEGRRSERGDSRAGKLT